MLKLRVTFVHRYSQFTFFDNQGREMFFEYAPLKSFGGPAASEKEP